jgi:23S rRNA pseudouridine2605 synthase
MEKRLQKILSELGVASRRKAEEIILEGRVTVNGKPAQLGQKANQEQDHIKLDGKLLTAAAEPKVYYMFNKPKNVMTTLEDPEGRPTISEFLKRGRIKYRVYPVGRLDFDSEGLLLITNDGDLAHSVLHPSKKIPKTYEVKIKGVLEDGEIERLERGIFLPDGKTAPARVRKLRKLKENSWVEITIYEGRKRQIRRMLQHVGHPVSRLIRKRIDGIVLGHLGPGELRPLRDEEVEKLKQNTGMALKEGAENVPGQMVR